MATQTSPSPSASSTNLTWASSSPCSDTESSEGSDPWNHVCPRRPWTSGKSNSAPILEKVSPSLEVKLIDKGRLENITVLSKKLTNNIKYLLNTILIIRKAHIFIVLEEIFIYYLIFKLSPLKYYK